MLGHGGDQRPWETPISVDTVGRSIKIAEYFRAHMVRLFVQRPNVRQILVLEWLRKKNAPDFVPQNLFRSVRRQFDESVETLNETLTELEQMGWIKKYSISTGGRETGHHTTDHASLGRVAYPAPGWDGACRSRHTCQTWLRRAKADWVAKVPEAEREGLSERLRGVGFHAEKRIWC